MAGTPPSSAPVAPAAPTREDPSPSRRAGPSARSHGTPLIPTVTAYKETGDASQPLVPLDPRVQMLYLNNPALDVPVSSSEDLLSLLHSAGFSISSGSLTSTTPLLVTPLAPSAAVVSTSPHAPTVLVASADESNMVRFQFGLSHAIWTAGFPLGFLETLIILPFSDHGHMVKYS